MTVNPNETLMKTSQVYRDLVALNCFSDEIEQLERNIESSRQDIFEWKEGDVKYGVKYERDFYPEEHISEEEFNSHLLEDAKRGFWGEPFIIVD